MNGFVIAFIVIMLTKYGQQNWPGIARTMRELKRDWQDIARASRDLKRWAARRWHAKRPGR